MTFSYIFVVFVSKFHKSFHALRGLGFDISILAQRDPLD